MKKKLSDQFHNFQNSEGNVLKVDSNRKGYDGCARPGEDPHPERG